MALETIQPESPNTSIKSSKSGSIALILCIFLGFLGAHRLYVGKIWTGLLMLITFGGLGIWSLVDAIAIISHSFEDKKGRLLSAITTEKPSSLRKALLILLAAFMEVLSMITFIILLVMYVTSDLVKTIEQQLEAARMKDFQRSYSFTAKDFQNSTSLDQFKLFINQYPPLSHNQSMSFSKKEMDGHRGRVVGTLQAKDGTIVTVEYLLVKENDAWKILGIKINPKETDQNEHSPALFTITSETSQTNTTTPDQPDENSSNFFVYKDHRTHFSAICLKTWEHGSKEKGAFFCTGKKGTPSDQTYISVRTIPAKKADGHILTVNDYINSMKRHILEIDPKAIFLAQGDAELPKNPQQYKGQYLLATFTYNNQTFKRLEFVVSKDNQSLLYDWSYTSTAAQYENDLPLAKQLYESMTID